MKKRILILLAALAISVFAFAACQQQADTPAPAPAADPAAPAAPATPATPEAPAAAEPAPPGVETTIPNVLFATGSLAVSMDPVGSNDSASALNNKQLFSTLLVQDYVTFDVHPALAIEWDLPDAQTVNMRLREGVTFHNGDPLTAYDVAFSLERAGASPQMDPIFGMIDSVTVVDELNFTIHLEIPFSPILRHLAHPGGSIVPRDHMLAVGEEAFAAHPIGSGPFEFVSHTIDVDVVMRRNENYWGELAVPETLTFVRIPDQPARLLAIEAGEVHIADAIAPADVARATASPDVNMMRRMNLSTNYIGFNTRAPYLDNPLVRQAINYALDNQAIIDIVLMGTGAPARGAIADMVWGFYDAGGFTQNIDRARELLTEAGLYPGGFNTTIWYNVPNMQRMQIAEMVQFALTPLNINVEIVGLEWGEYLDRVAEGEHDMFILGWVSVTGDADYGLFPLFHSSMYGAAGNRTFWSTPEMDDLLERGRMSVNDVERLDIYRQAQIILYDEAPWIFLNQGETLLATVPQVNGFEIAPAGHHSFRGVWGN